MIIIPELQFYFNEFVKNTTLNKDEVPFPAQIERKYLDEDRSFIRLLFDDNWPKDYDYFFYYFREIKDPIDWPPCIQTRGGIFASSSQYFVACDSTSDGAINIFNLSGEEVEMLSRLLLFRLDPCSFKLDIEFESLTKNLSKLIWLYLKFKIDKDTSHYNGTELISNPNNILENMYECYLIETIFKVVQQRGR